MQSSIMFLISCLALLSTIAVEVAAEHHHEQTFKACGAKLYTHIQNHNLCQPNNCTGITRPPTVHNFYSIHGKATTKISEHCCVNPCYPSMVRALCCGL